MKLLEVEFYSGESTRGEIVVELDVKQPNKGSNEACDHDVPGGVPLACIQEGPLTSRVLQGSGKLVRGTLLAGQVWFRPVRLLDKYDRLDPHFRWTEATLPDGSKHPVCIEERGQGKHCPNGASKECAARPAQIVKQWQSPLTP
jgi:hypothetical protein